MRDSATLAGSEIEYIFSELSSHIRRHNAEEGTFHQPIAHLRLEDIRATLFFSIGAHAGQTRKHSGASYIVHPSHVASILIKHADKRFVTTEMVQALLMHDTVEDTPVTVDEIHKLFGLTPALIVEGMTKVDVEGNRAARKGAERERYRKIMTGNHQLKAEIATGKCCDMISNLKDTYATNPEFYPKYATEQLLLLDILEAQADETLVGLVREAASKGE